MDRMRRLFVKPTTTTAKDSSTATNTRHRASKSRQQNQQQQQQHATTTTSTHTFNESSLPPHGHTPSTSSLAYVKNDDKGINSSKNSHGADIAGAAAASRAKSPSFLNYEFLNLDHSLHLSTPSGGSSAFSSSAVTTTEDGVNHKAGYAKASAAAAAMDSSEAHGITFSLLRFPLLFAIGVVLIIELIAYVTVRQLVNLWEWLFVWRGERRRLRAHLNAAKTYQEWVAAAHVLDSFLAKEAWKEQPASPHYDANLVSRTVQYVRLCRALVMDGGVTHQHLLHPHVPGHSGAASSQTATPSEDMAAVSVKTAAATAEEAAVKSRGIHRLMDVMLQGAVKANFAGVENSRLYSQTYFGTKRIIEEYYEEVKLTLDMIANSESVSIEEKRQFFKSCSRLYGQSVLCFSGGAMFGLYHFGVVKALLESNNLPKVISGASAGSIMGAFVCVRTDDELRADLNPKLLSRSQVKLCSDPIWVLLLRLLRSGALYDQEQWSRALGGFLKGNITFREAYEISGRVLNISVVSADGSAPPKLLNYITAPDVVILSAVLASSSLPGILTPVTLLMKRNGQIGPYINSGSRWRDGSLRIDIPIRSLTRQFLVNFSIVSQVNPHIVLWFFHNKGTVGRPSSQRQGTGWRGSFVLSYSEYVLKLDMLKWVKILSDLHLLPQIFHQDWSLVWLQKFDGTVTVTPKPRVRDYIHIMSDPTEAQLSAYIDNGELATWPRLHMIGNRMSVEHAIEKYIARFKKVKTTTTNNSNNLNHSGIVANTTHSTPATTTPVLSSSSSSSSLVSVAGTPIQSPRVVATKIFLSKTPSPLTQSFLESTPSPFATDMDHSSNATAVTGLSGSHHGLQQGATGGSSGDTLAALAAPPGSPSGVSEAFSILPAPAVWLTGEEDRHPSLAASLQRLPESQLAATHESPLSRNVEMLSPSFDGFPSFHHE